MHTLTTDTNIRRAFSDRRANLIRQWEISYNDLEPGKDYGRSFWARLIQEANDAELVVLKHFA